MKKVGDIMRELGFRDDAPQSLKEAFIKNLIKSAYGVEIETPSEKRHEALQLSFDFFQAPEKPQQIGRKVS